MSQRSIRAWYLTHKWTSLVCTLFLLMLCVTGLPLIFHDEIDAATGHGVSATGQASSGNGPGLISLDAMLARALRDRPGEVPLFMAFDNDRPAMTVTTGPTPDAPGADMHLQLLDRSTGRPIRVEGGGITDFLLQLHTDMFLGLKGELFLGAMGLLFVAAIVSGVVLYAPFMRKLDFGTLRTGRSARVKWLDWHNLIGIVGLAWMTVVGVTGVVNSFVTPITKVWQANELADMTRAYAGRPPVPPSRYGSLDIAMATARRAIPGMNPQFIAFPGGNFSSGHHYAVYFQGNTPLTERLLTVALIDAETGKLTDARPMPWYFKALSLSRPLHFGDYGGLPLKLLWAALDLFAIVVLGSGLYLWLGRRRVGVAAHVREVASGAAVPAE
ncbi:MAG: PepSY domain-containing protein [Sphingomonas sp.]|uniref:PepSY-associated TM helix domain-containing protein n=1 Tax=Sphingomonas sp. TaxID=28214 RepID=UPI001AC74317|nr:PepSY domain-containing protein [Sphingomonas sp.]MBN8806756.1 PepSY domain-containing protein [Sphingomonas sp.]